MIFLEILLMINLSFYFRHRIQMIILYFLNMMYLIKSLLKNSIKLNY